MRLHGVIALLLVAENVIAQDLIPAAPLGELGLRYWVTTGETKHSHNAQGISPGFGNPTSVLVYENLDANVLELFGRLNFDGNWFLKGSLGVGRINTGAFDDEDFNAGQVKFSDTTSSVPRGWLGYGTIDFGRNEWRLRQGRTVLGAFIGLSQWTEDVDAYGATDHLGGIGGDISRNEKVLSNKVIWRALRVGLAGSFAFTERSRLDLDLAFIPYARVRNEDSHHLRADPSDLGPVPNIILKGTGRGVQLDAELRHTLYPGTDIGLGLRYWYLESTDAKRQLPNFPDFPELPAVDLYSVRFGVTLSLRRTW